MNKGTIKVMKGMHFPGKPGISIRMYYVPTI